MIRRPLRPLARILQARSQGADPDLIEAEERAARLAEAHRAERKKASPIASSSPTVTRARASPRPPRRCQALGSSLSRLPSTWSTSAIPA